MYNLTIMFQTWFNVLTSPSDETFETEKQKPDATFKTAIIWVFIATVISMILGILQTAIGFSTFNSMGIMDQILSDPNIPPEAKEFASIFFSSGGATTLIGTGLVLSLIFAPIMFIIGVGIDHFIASILGGKGQFEKLAYLTAAYTAPITIITSILGLIPVLGGCLATLLSIYQFILGYFAIKVNYGFSSGRAIAVIAAPFIFFLAIFACIAIFFLSTSMFTN